MRKSTCRCGTPRVVTLDALKRPRLRCPQCDGVAGKPRRRAIREVAEEFVRTSAFVTESEE